MKLAVGQGVAWGRLALARAPALTLALLLGPVVAGLLGTLLPALGGWPPAESVAPQSLHPWRMLLADPGFGRSLVLTLWTGFIPTALALLLTMALLATCWDTRWLERLRGSLAPLLAIPSAALALGLAFLIAPSGWLVRWLSPWATGWSQPPNLVAFGPQDPGGLSLILALWLRETPYLLFMGLVGLNQLPVAAWSLIARSLGYGPSTGFLKIIWPSLYPLLRLPVFAALVFSFTVVDTALVIGPSTPPTLAVQVLRWFHHPDLTWRWPAAAAAVLLILLSVLALGVWEGATWLMGRLSRFWLTGGGRGGSGDTMRRVTLSVGGAALALAGLSVVGLLLWSLARTWPFPLVWPEQWALAVWRDQGSHLLRLGWNTVLIGAAATSLALALTVACLEQEARYHPTFAGHGLWLLYLPLLVPQVSFLFGIQVVLVWSGWDGGWLALVWMHWLFVLPYVFLSLADPWRAFDVRYEQTALALGVSRARAFWRIKLPMLRGPLLVAAAVGFAVSVAQYLPTVLIGAGRYATLTTEAVALASGGNRRIIGVFAIAQAALPLLGFVVVLWMTRGLKPVATHAGLRGL